MIDSLLSQPEGISGEEADWLLDFRQALRQRREPELVLRSFCELRRRLETRHYLAFFRLRRYLENQIVVRVASPNLPEFAELPLRLDFYCVEAVRRSCLCQAAHGGLRLTVPRLSFAFREVPAAGPAPGASKSA